MSIESSPTPAVRDSDCGFGHTVSAVALCRMHRERTRRMEDGEAINIIFSVFNMTINRMTGKGSQVPR